MDRRRAWAALLACVLVLLAGCGGLVELSRPADRAPVFPSWTGCGAEVPAEELMQSNDRPEQGRVPGAFAPVLAVECRTDDRDHDRSAHGVEVRATDIKGLLAELDRPSEHAAPGASVSCAGFEWRRPWLFLLDAQGRWVIPQVPSNACGHPLLPEKGHAEPTWERHATWTLDRSKLLEIEDLGCQPRERLDGILLDPDQGNDHRAAIRPAELAGRITSVCRYRVPVPHPPLTHESHFTSGSELTAAQAAAVRSSLVEKPADACHQTATSYATLQGIGDWIAIAVELDGCQRMLETYASDRDHRAAAASPELVALLTG